MVFKKIRLYYLILWAFLKQQKKIIFVSFLLSLIIFYLFTKLLPYIPRPKPTYKIGLIGNYAFTEIPLSVTSLSSWGLTKIAEDGSVLPSLAKSWTVSPDEKVYTFTLAENIFWQNGEPVVAADINYDLPGVTQKVVDNSTLQYTLKEPFSPFPSLLAQPIFKNTVIGTGKYELKKVSKSGQFITKLIANGPDKNFIFNFYPTQKAAFEAFKLGEVDQLDNLTYNFITPEWSPYVRIEEKINKDQYIGLFLNFNDNNLNSKNLRQALAYATPKPSDNTRALSPINPQSWAYNPDVKKYNSDATQAKRLYQKFLEESNQTNINLKINTTNNLLVLADQIKKSWEDILGIPTEVGLIDNLTPDFQILLIASQIPSDPDQYSFWHSTQKSNLTGYKSPKVDKILEDARRVSDLTERKEKYLDFQKFLLEDSPVIFISHPITYKVIRQKITF